MNTDALTGRLFLCLKMSFITKQKTYVDNDPIIYSDLNANFDALYDLVNGNLDNSNIASGAAIDPTKISGGAVTLTTAQTVSGQKTFIKPIVNAIQNLIADAFASTITFDMSQSNLHKPDPLTGNVTLAVSNVDKGQAFVVILQQDGTGGRTVTWWNNIKWVTGAPPVLSTAANAADIFQFIFDGTTYYGSIVGLSYA